MVYASRKGREGREGVEESPVNLCDLCGLCVRQIELLGLRLGEGSDFD